MITDYINEILLDHRNSISIEKMNDILKEFNIYIEENNLSKNSKYFSLCNGSVFLKEKFDEQKELFFHDFDDYIKTKILDSKVRQNIIENLKFFIPDILFVEYININLEDKILIFDLFLMIMQKPKSYNNDLKNYFNNLIEFYSVVIVYASLLVENYNDNLSNLTKMINKIEESESILKNHLFNIMTLPSVVSQKLIFWEEEFYKTKGIVTMILEDFFSESMKYSKTLLKRVITKELENFTVVSLLTRFEFSALLDYLLMLTEHKKPRFKHNLFEDLGL